MSNIIESTEAILKTLGGKENISSATHCSTRLKVVLKDESKIDLEALKKVSGVQQVVNSEGQCQIVLDTASAEYYDEFVKQSNINDQATADKNSSEGLTHDKKKKSFKDIGNAVLQYIAAAITPALPVFVVAGIFKMLATLLGPGNFGILTDTNNFYRLCNLVSDAGFYYLPFFVAYGASKKLKYDPVLPMIMVAIMLAPSMVSMVTAGEAFDVYGIPMTLINYQQAVLPILIIVWAMTYVEKFVNKIVPDSLKSIGVPVLTIAVMLPLGLCLLGPVCNIVMGWMGSGVLWMTQNVGVPTIVIVAVLWPILAMFGAHIPMMVALLPTWLEMGYDAIISPASLANSVAGFGVALGYAIRAKKKEEREFGWSVVLPYVTNVAGAFTYGIFLRDKRAFAYTLIGSGVGAAVMGIIGAKVTLFTGVGLIFLGFLRFGEYAIQGAIGLLAAFGSAFALSLIFGFGERSKEDLIKVKR